ncbi:MAG: translation elongation factor 4, partial [Candidatus Latescibacteria bacterium]|nr:translation elongation factor 4 [Candidatus Latescibacterota bacterium]
MQPQSLIRNFSIIAHIDHGKSTLADRLLEATGTLSAKEMKEQVLDSMDLERERGITIKSHAIRMVYTATDGQTYTLNLIDTPGHVDFSYEVSRSLAACEGAVLVVDAAQGVEAQTVSNLYQAMNADLSLIPVLNKIDLPSARTETVTGQLHELIGVEPEEVYHVSAKQGLGVSELLEIIISEVPPPNGDPDKPLRALIFDSIYDPYVGAIVYVRVVDGEIRKGMTIRLSSTGAVHEVGEIGVLRLKKEATGALGAGEVGYVVCGIKDVAEAHVGDTVVNVDEQDTEPLPGYHEVKPMVFSGLYPVNSDDFEDLRAALERLRLNDAALIYEPETSSALGFGFRCGFLGLLHMEIIQERLDREFAIDIITTVPNVRYMAHTTDGNETWVETPAKMPEPSALDHLEEPFLSAQIISPTEYVGNIMKLCQDRRGVYLDTHYLDPNTVELRYDLPLSEIVFDFYDRLKSNTRGYASFDYELKDYRPSPLVKLDIMINSEPVDALSIIVHQDKA